MVEIAWNFGIDQKFGAGSHQGVDPAVFIIVDTNDARDRVEVG